MRSGPVGAAPLCLPERRPSCRLPKPQELGPGARLKQQRVSQWVIAGLVWASQACAGRCCVCSCVGCVCPVAGECGQAVVDRREHTGAIGQCTPVKGWMGVDTAGLVGIMPFELGRGGLRGLRSGRRIAVEPPPQPCGRARAVAAVVRRGQARSWPRGRVCRWQSAAESGRAYPQGVRAGRDGRGRAWSRRSRSRARARARARPQASSKAKAKGQRSEVGGRSRARWLWLVVWCT